MGRPVKKGLDYFPLDVALDDNLELLVAEHGLIGFAIVVKLWQKIYANGYFIAWDNDIQLLFSHKINTDKNLILAVIQTCFSRNLFDFNLYQKFGILTSSGIQKRFSLISNKLRRGSSRINPDFLVVSSEEMPVNSVGKCIKEKKGNEIKEIKNKEKKIDPPREKRFLPLAEVFEILAGDIKWHSSIMKHFAIKSGEMLKWLEIFKSTLQASGAEEKTIGDAKHHFNCWLAKKIPSLTGNIENPEMDIFLSEYKKKLKIAIIKNKAI